MNARNMLLMAVVAFASLMASAEDVDTCAQVQRTQEQFQQELKEFREETQAYMLYKDPISVDSVHLLSEEQMKTLKYAKNPKKIFGKENRVKLPMEVCNVAGDTVVKEMYSVPQWDKAYFKNHRHYAAYLVIPLEGECGAGKVYSEMKVLCNYYGGMRRIVYSDFVFESESVTRNVIIRSNIYGDFLDAIVCEDGVEVSRILGKERNTRIVDDSKSSNRKEANRTVSNTRYTNSKASLPSISSLQNWLSRNMVMPIGVSVRPRED